MPIPSLPAGLGRGQLLRRGRQKAVIKVTNRRGRPIRSAIKTLVRDIWRAKVEKFSKKNYFANFLQIGPLGIYASVMSGAPKATGASEAPRTRPAFPVSANFARRSPLGRHRRKQHNSRISHRLPFAAAPALLGVAAAITLSAQMIPSPAFASTLSRHSESAGQSWKVANAQLLAAIHPVAAQRQATARKAAARPAKYTVRPGDTLSAIAGKVYHDPGAWPVLYWANRDKIRWADNVDAGQVLTVPVKPARIPAAPAQLAARPRPPPPRRPARSRRRPTSRRRPGSPSPRRARAPTRAQAPSRSA